MKRSRIVFLVLASLVIVSLLMTLLTIEYRKSYGENSNVNEGEQKDISSNYISEENVFSIPENEQSALKAQLILKSGFIRDMDTEPVYPDEFCGAYCSDGKLYVYLTMLDGETLTRYNRIFTDSGLPDLSVVVYKKLNYNENMLSIYGEDIYKRLIEGGHQADFWRADEYVGKIIISLHPTAKDYARDYVDEIIEYGIYSGLKKDDVILETVNWVPCEKFDFYSPSYDVMMAYGELMSSFEEDGKYLYPDEYCGCYGDEQLHVCLTSIEDSIVEEYDKLFSNPDVIIYEQRTVSKKLLLSYMFDMIDRIINKGMTLYDYDFNETNGKIEIIVPEHSVNEIKKYLDGLITANEYEGLKISDIVITAS